MRLFRHNLSGGVMGDDLHYRSDLEAYHKGNLQQNNFLPTPYGGIMRRPPTVKLLGHGSVTVDGVVYAPDAVRYFDFVYDREAQYVAALISYAAAGQDSWSRFEIFDTAGTLKDTVDCDYAALNFHELSVRQLNDVMYVAHNGYRLSTLVRNGDEDWGLNRVSMKGGPLLPWNVDATTLSVEKEAYDAGVTYGEGYVVHSGVDNLSVTAAAYVLWYYSYQRFARVTRSEPHYLLRLTIGSGHGIVAGDVVVLSGFSGVSVELNGVYDVKAVSSTTVDIDTNRWLDHTTITTSVWRNDIPLPTSFSDEKVGKNGGDHFFMSLKDGNTGNALPVAPAIETAWWRRTALVGEITLKSSDDLFTDDNLGQKIFCAVNIAQTYDGVFDAVGESSDPVAYSNGAVTLRTEGGVWGGICALQKSTDGGVTWETIGVVNGGGGNHNGEITRDIGEPEALLRVYMRTYETVTGGTNCKWQLEFPSGTPFIGTITEYTDARTVMVFPETALMGLFQTKNWRLGAFNDANGYPGVVCIHDERLMLGGSKLQPFMLWGSAINNWENYAEGVLETSPLALQANADRATRLCWMASKGELLFGTDFNEYSAGSRDSDKVISASNPPKIAVQNSYSSAPIQALLIGEDVFFVQSDYKTLRAMAFNNEKWGYSGKNMTIACPDIAGSGFRWLAVQKSPFPIIWAGTQDDDLVSFTYDAELNIMGWARHPLAGASVVSGCVIPTLGDDSIIICTNRGGTFCMEKMSYANTSFVDDQGGSESEMESLIQTTNLLQQPNVLEELRARITKVYLYLKESQGGEVSVDGGESWTEIEYPDSGLFTGKVEVLVNSGTTENASPIIRTRGVQPFTLLAIGLDVDRQTTKD
jgi:hypothetical protein